MLQPLLPRLLAGGLEIARSLAGAPSPLEIAPEPTEPAASPAASPTASPAVILLCTSDTPAGSPTLAAIHRALVAELAELSSEVILRCEAPTTALSAQIAGAHAALTTPHALAALWLRVEGDELLLFIATPDEDAARLRRIEPNPGTSPLDPTNLDAAAVIARATVDALLRPPLTPPGPPAPEPPKPTPEPASDTTAASGGDPRGTPPRASRRLHLRVLLGYSGSRYAPPFAWLSGVELGLGALWASGGYVGLGYLINPPMALAPYPIGGDDLVFASVHRRPLSLYGGYHRLWPVHRHLRLGLEAEFAIAVDITRARTPILCIDGQGERCPSTHALQRPDPTLFTLGFVPRLRLLIQPTPTPTLLLYLGLGLDGYADRTIYATCTAESPEGCRSGILLAPYNLRPVAQAGILLRL